MKIAFRLAAFAFLLIAASEAAARETSTSIGARTLPAVDPCKNHYILDEPAGCHWVLTADLNAARAGHTATLLPDGRVLVVGGSDDPGGAEIFDPRTGQWRLTAPPNNNRRMSSATLLANGKVLVAGNSPGWTATPYVGAVIDDSAEIFDPATETWTFTGRMAAQTYGFVAVPLTSGKVLLVGGADRFAQPVATAQLYDPDTGSWTLIPGPAVFLSGFTATRLADGRVLVVGGDAYVGDVFEQSINGTYIYDPATGGWSRAGSLQQPRQAHAATLLPDGSVLVSGGYDLQQQDYGYAASVSLGERFDPATGRWQSVGELAISRFSHTATLLADGSVLISGGVHFCEVPYGLGCGLLASSELSRSRGQQWVAAPALNIARRDHTATVLGNGSILVTGGLNERGEPLKSAEILEFLMPR